MNRVSIRKYLTNIKMQTFDHNLLQKSASSCAVKCQQIIMRDYGIDVSEDCLCCIASRCGWYDEAVGMRMSDNGKLLGSFGISYHHSQLNSLEDIKREIDKGHRVMVNVNRHKLCDDISFRDVCEASHAVIVRDIDLSGNAVVLTNPATGHIAETYTLEIFDKAWSDSCRYMLATDSPAEYEYSSHTRSMRGIVKPI